MKDKKTLILRTQLTTTGKKLYKVPPFLTRHISKNVQVYKSQYPNLNLHSLDDNIIADAILYNDYITSQSDILPGVFLHTLTLLKNLNNKIRKILQNIETKADNKFKYEASIRSDKKYNDYIEIRKQIYKKICYCQLWLYVMFLHQQSNNAAILINSNKITVKERILDKINKITKELTDFFTNKDSYWVYKFNIYFSPTPT